VVVVLLIDDIVDCGDVPARIISISSSSSPREGADDDEKKEEDDEGDLMGASDLNSARDSWEIGREDGFEAEFPNTI